MSSSRLTKTALQITGLIKPSTPKQVRENGGYGKFQLLEPRGTFLEGSPDTCCPSFVISGTFRYDEKRKVFKMDQKTQTYTYAKKNKTHVTRDDVLYFIAELEIQGDAKSCQTLLDAVPCTVSEFTKAAFFADFPFKSQCDFFRVEYEAPLRVAFSKQPVIRKLSGETLEQVHQILFGGAWKLWFHKYTKPLGLKEMTLQGYTNFRFAYKQQLPYMFYTALRLYAHVKERREMGDDAFEKESLLKDFLRSTRARENNDTPALVDKALEFLMFHALEEPFPGILALPKDVLANRIIAEGLSMMRGEPKIRPAPFSPCMPSATLGEIQKSVIRHVHTNKITLLQGAPGTGKTEVLVGIMAEFAAPLVVTYVGMMVDALQGRFGKRTETANTIHYICTMAELAPEVTEAWLSKFDLIVIDEGSNVDTHLLARILRHVSCHVCRLVIVGDLGQIFPIKPGCPFFDLLRAYPHHTFELVENKRVDPDSRELANASATIARCQTVEFNRFPCLKLIPELTKETLQRVLAEFIHSIEDMMKMQIITLRNKDRKLLNEWAEEILIERHILKRSGAVVFIGEHSYFPGKKVMFNKNVKGTEKYDGVRNGELGQVAQVKKNQGETIVTLTNGKVVCITADNPYLIQPGYATTSNKSQGSEWENILFWVYENPNDLFSCEYPYVAVSRAKKRCIVAGAQRDFDALCSRRARPRNTLLQRYLYESPLLPYEEVELRDPTLIKLLPADMEAVPRLELGVGNKSTTKRAKRQS